MAAQAAVAAVRKGCEMLNEGKAEISKLKKTVEQGIGDAKAIYSEVTGLWSWIKGLLGGKQEKPKSTPVAVAVEAPKPLAKKADRKPNEQLSYEEYQTQAIHQVCEQLKTFFEIRRQLKDKSPLNDPVVPDIGFPLTCIVPAASGRVSVLFVLLLGLSRVKIPLPEAFGASLI